MGLDKKKKGDMGFLRRGGGTLCIENNFKKAEWSKKELNCRLLKTTSWKIVGPKKMNQQSSSSSLIL